MRFDVDARPDEHAELLTALARLGTIRSALDPIQPQLAAVAADVSADLPTAELHERRVRRLFVGRDRKEAARAADDRIEVLLTSSQVTALVERISTARDQIAGRRTGDPWQVYLANPVWFNGLLAELTGRAESEASRGFLPTDLVDRIEATELDLRLLKATLRGYQSFGAKFAIAQVRTILGDEMGLGKTVQALAVLCHLRARGYRHFLIVCPASVLTNWEHEVARHTSLDSTWRLHGADREDRVTGWLSTGGVAITTFATLPRLELPDVDIAAVIIDEAHYVKNPDAQRTRAVEAWLAKPSYTILMTGTPMENRVDEFASLVQLIRPDVAAHIQPTHGLAGADAFRQTVAPVYLRRNIDDVLDELPPKIETTEWLTLDGNSFDVYRAAVASGNFTGHATSRLHDGRSGRLAQDDPASRDRCRSGRQPPQGCRVLILPRGDRSGPPGAGRTGHRSDHR